MFYRVLSLISIFTISNSKSSLASNGSVAPVVSTIPVEFDVASFVDCDKDAATSPRIIFPFSVCSS